MFHAGDSSMSWAIYNHAAFVWPLALAWLALVVVSWSFEARASTLLSSPSPSLLSIHQRNQRQQLKLSQNYYKEPPTSKHQSPFNPSTYNLQHSQSWHQLTLFLSSKCYSHCTLAWTLSTLSVHLRSSVRPSITRMMTVSFSIAIHQSIKL